MTPAMAPLAPTVGTREERIEDNMQDASGKPTEQIKTEKANPAHTVFHIIAKDPEGPHIPDDVHPATMQKHRRQQGEVVWMQ